MKTNRWIDGSRRLFACLLNLYPRQYRSEYAVSMSQVFVDQCRDTYREKGAVGIFLLWLRILPDLGYTAIVEHLTMPHAGWGLLEPVPNAPLPWKGVFLILLPGLVYLVSQIAQLTGEPWYLTVYYRAAFVLIIPVIIVWIATRRFPIWGLIPVGLLFRLVKEIGYQLIVLHPGIFSSNPFFQAILSLARIVENNLFIPSILFLAVSVILAFWYFRRNRSNRNGKIWLGIFLFIIAAQIFHNFYSAMTDLPYVMMAEKLNLPVDKWLQANFIERIPLVYDLFRQIGIWDALVTNASYILYNSLALMLLIFLGTFFTRRHGFFTIFILVGYFLPAMLVGLPPEAQNDSALLLQISIAIMVYRSLLSLVAPIWMSRTALIKGKKRAILVCIALALAVQFAMHFFLAYTRFGQWYLSVILDDLLLVIGVLLGVALYQVEPVQSGSAATLPDHQMMLSIEN